MRTMKDKIIGTLEQAVTGLGGLELVEAAELPHGARATAGEQVGRLYVMQAAGLTSHLVIKYGFAAADCAFVLTGPALDCLEGDQLKGRLRPGDDWAYSVDRKGAAGHPGGVRVVKFTDVYYDQDRRLATLVQLVREVLAPHGARAADADDAEAAIWGTSYPVTDNTAPRCPDHPELVLMFGGDLAAPGHGKSYGCPGEGGDGHSWVRLGSRLFRPDSGAGELRPADVV